MTATIIPTLRYREAVAAIEWLCRAFGFQEHLLVPGEDGSVAHSQLVFGNCMVMLGSGGDGEFDQIQVPPNSSDHKVNMSPYVIVNDVDAHHRQALAEGADIVMPPEDQDYGGRLYSCRDPEGYLWNFGSYYPRESQ